MTDGYAIFETVGAGAWSMVHRAVDLRVGREAAIKFPRPELADHPETVARFHAEAETLARLQHPHIVQLYGLLNTTGGRAAMATEFVRGPSLDQRLQLAPLERRPALEIALALVDALAHMHARGVAHRDLKPANVLLAGGRVPKIADFGGARRLRRDSFGEVIGSLEYLAPERIAGAPGDEKCDVYAWGLIVWRMLYGRLPFAATSEEAVLDWHLRGRRPSGPAWLRPALAVRPEDRPTARELAKSLRLALSAGDLLRWFAPFVSLAGGLLAAAIVWT